MKILSRYISTSRMSSRINTLRFHLLRIHLAVNTSIKGTREQVPQNLYTRELHIDSFKNFSKWLTAVHEYSRPYNKRSWSMKTTLSISKIYAITLDATDTFKSEHVQRWRHCNNNDITGMRETKMGLPFLVKLQNLLLSHSFFKKSSVLPESQIEEVC